MANKRTSNDLNDDLLSLGTPAKQEKVDDFDTIAQKDDEELTKPDLTPVVEDDEDAEIAALKAALAQPLPETKEFLPPKKDSELTPKERELRELRDQMARRQATIAETAEDVYESTEGKDVILIHILADGFTINGQVTYRGREFEFVKGGQAHEQTKDRYGKSWLDLTEDDQYDRWGELKFGHGPWPFKRLSALTLADLPEGSTPEDLEAVQRAAARNDRRAPIFTR